MQPSGELRDPPSQPANCLSRRYTYCKIMDKFEQHTQIKIIKNKYNNKVLHLSFEYELFKAHLRRVRSSNGFMTRALRALVVIGLSLNPEGRKRQAGAHQLPTLDFFMIKKCFNQELMILKKFIIKKCFNQESVKLKKKNEFLQKKIFLFTIFLRGGYAFSVKKFLSGFPRRKLLLNYPTLKLKMLITSYIKAVDNF